MKASLKMTSEQLIQQLLNVQSNYFKKSSKHKFYGQLIEDIKKNGLKVYYHITFENTGKFRYFIGELGMNFTKDELEFEQLIELTTYGMDDMEEEINFDVSKEWLLDYIKADYRCLQDFLDSYTYDDSLEIYYLIK